MQIRHLPNRDHHKRRHHSQVRINPLATFFNGVPSFAGPPISERPLAIVAQAVSNTHRRAETRDGFLALPSCLRNNSALMYCLIYCPARHL
jgi:hypothetical protein